MTPCIAFRWQWRFLRLCASLTVLGCGELPYIHPGVCGNAILETGEDCDTYAESGKTCRPPSTTDDTGCHYDCSVSGNSQCPENARCGLDGVCHYMSDEHAKWGKFVPMPAQSLQLGDFDGDGREDLLALGGSNGLWQAYPRVLFFGKDGQPQDVIDPRLAISSPIVMALDPSDGQAHQSKQIVFSSEYGIGAAEFTSDRAVLPIPYPIQVLPQGWSYRVMRLGQVTQHLLHEVVLLFMSGEESDAAPGFIAVASQVELGQLGPLPKPVSDFAGAPVAADLVDLNSPCEEAVFAYRGDSQVYLFEPCDAEGALVGTNSPHPVTALPGTNTIGQTPIPALVNKEDTKLDLLIADTASKPYAAFGRGDGSFAADPSNFEATRGMAWPVSVDKSANCGPQFEVDDSFPLAVADLNGDGLTDWVTHKGVQLTQSVDVDPALQQVRITACIFESPYARQWSIAKIADVNGDGHLDVIAGSDSAADLDLWRGTNVSGLNQSAILTGGPVHHLGTGDFDGDGVTDIVFDALRTAHDTDDPGSYTLSIAFSRVAQPPETPIDIGNFTSIDQVETALYEGLDTMAEIGVIATPSDSPGQQLSVFIGSAGRRPIAPMGLQAPGPSPGQLIDGVPLTLAAGKLLGSDHPSLIVASIWCEAVCEDRLWLVPNLSAGKYTVPVPSVVLPDTFVPYRVDKQELSVQLFAGDIDGDGNDDAFALTNDTADSNVNLWRIVLPAQEGTWTQAPPLALLSSTQGRLTLASHPTLVDLNRDKKLDLALIVDDGNGSQRLGVVYNQDGALDITRIRYIDFPSGQFVRAFASFDDRGDSRLYAITDEATYVIGAAGDAGTTLQPTLVPDVSGGISIAVGDLTGYGLRDLAIGNSDGVQFYQEVPRNK